MVCDIAFAQPCVVRALAVACALGLLSVPLHGCPATEEDDGGGSSETGPGEPRTTLIATVPSSACDEVGVVSIQIRALRYDCEFQPCTKPANPQHELGDMATCPITDPERLLGIDVDQSGYYYVDTAADRTPDDPTYECHGTTVMQPSVLVTSVDLENRAEYSLVALGNPCPEPD
jgi:hypothetical protein